MPKVIALVLPILYAIFGGVLWFIYGTEYWAIGLWLVVQVFLIFIYKWLIADKSLGLMLKFHLISTGMGMLILFYVLTPRDTSSSGLLILEVVLMVFGTFCCSVGLFSLLYMTIRKLIRD